MPTKSNIIYDGFSVLDGGIHSGIAPTLLPKNQMGFAVNATVRGGFATDRPPFQKIRLSTPLPASLWQGARNYQPDAGDEGIVVSIAGRLFLVTPDNAGNATCVEISIQGDLNPPGRPQAWMAQAENYMIVTDGISLPLFFDGTTTRRSLGSSQQLGIVDTGGGGSVPAIGSTVGLTLVNDYTGPLNVAIQLNGAYYVVKVVGSNLPYNAVVLKNINDSPGNIVPPNTGLIVQPATIGIVASLGGNYVTLDRAIPSYVSVGQLTNISITLNSWGGGYSVGPGTIAWLDLVNNRIGFTGGPNPTTGVVGAVMTVSGGVIPANQTVGTVGGGGFVAPAQGSTVNVTLSSAYVEANGQLVYIGSALYQVQGQVSPPVPSDKMIIVQNLNDAATVILDGAVLSSLPELPAGRMLTYGMYRVWESMTDGINFIAGDIDGGSSGSPSGNYRDAVLHVTENDYLAGGGTFKVPGSTGAITGMIFTATLDASLGQGPLQVFTNLNVFSCQAPVDRTKWQTLTNPILTEALKGAGGSGQDALVNSNADVLFRSPDAQLRSLLLARLDFNQWGDTPISHEIKRIIQSEDESLMPYCSAITFDNRMLMTCYPSQADNGVIWGGLIALNFDNISSLQNKSQSVYDGVWTGLSFLRLIRFNTVNRAFAFCLNQATGAIELYEILQTGGQHQDVGTYPTPVEWSFESPVLFNEGTDKGIFDLVRLIDGEIYIGDLEGRADIAVEYRPDYSPCWYLWRCFYVCSSIGAGLANQYRCRIGLGEPTSKNCVEFNNKPAREARFFQLRITVRGHCVFMGAKLGSVPIPEPEFAPPICNK